MDRPTPNTWCEQDPDPNARCTHDLCFEAKRQDEIALRQTDATYRCKDCSGLLSQTEALIDGLCHVCALVCRGPKTTEATETEQPKPRIYVRTMTQDDVVRELRGRDQVFSFRLGAESIQRKTLECRAADEIERLRRVMLSMANDPVYGIPPDVREQLREAAR